MSKSETGEAIDAAAKPLAKTPPAELLDREKILSGLDFEISRLKSEADHQGMSYWGLVVSAVAIFWTGLNLAFAEKHHWAHVLLVFFAAYLFLNHVRYLLGDFPPFRTKQTEASGPTRHTTLSNAFLMGGFRTDMLVYAFVEYSILLAASLPLFWRGYANVGAVIAGVSLLILTVISLGLLAAQVRLPLFDPMTLGDATPPPLLRRVLFFVLAAVFACVPIPAILTASPPISGSDWKQGLLSACFLILLTWIANRSSESPQLKPLIRIRTDLAFGWTTPETAKADVEDLLLGIPPDRVLANHVRRISGLFDRIRRRSDQVADEMEAIIALKKECDAHGDQQSFKLRQQAEIVHAGRFVFQVTKKIFEMWDRTRKVERTIDTRIEIGRRLLEFSGVDIKKNMRPAVAAKYGAAMAYHRLEDLLKPFFDAYNAMVIRRSDSEVLSVSMAAKMKEIREILSAE